jgi:hypothetical protein
MNTKYGLKSYELKNEIIGQNTSDVFFNQFDITWATEENNPNSLLINADALTHKIADRTWDKIPIEDIKLDHKNCKNDNIIYKYNNEYFRSDDFTNVHDGLHVLFAGCSESEGVGHNIEHAWTHKLYTELKKTNKLSGFYSIARAGYGWQKIISNFLIYVEKYGFPQYFFVLMPNIGREYRYINNYTKDGQTSSHYRYFQLYPSKYEYNDDSNLYSVDGSLHQPKHKIEQNNNVIFVEDYMKSLIDFNISWKLFEKFCESNNTKIIWSTWNGTDENNFIKSGITSNYFGMMDSEYDIIIKELSSKKLQKYDLVLRDGHKGTIVKEYWAKRFLDEINKRGGLND